MVETIKKHLFEIILSIGIVAYITYFSTFTILRHQKHFSHYFDLGIMHQTVYNTYQAIRTSDTSRILELTDPHAGDGQVKRMAIHNDLFLFLLAPFYFIYTGPETLLVIQAIILGFGAAFIYLITKKIFSKFSYCKYFALTFSLAYLFYWPLQRANNFDFHAVSLSTTFLLAMYYYWLSKRFWLSIFFAALSISTKEQVGLTVAFFGIYTFIKKFQEEKVSLFSVIKKSINNKINFGYSIKHLLQNNAFGVITIILGLSWVFVSMKFIIPHFRMGDHFGEVYFEYLYKEPWKALNIIFRPQSSEYIFQMLMPLGLLSLLSPLHFLIALPEILMNILSKNPNLRDLYFHYSSIITPFIFISAIYGARNLLSKESRLSYLIGKVKFILIRSQKIKNFLNHVFVPKRYIFILIFIAACIAFTSYRKSPLPWSVDRDMYPWNSKRAFDTDVRLWKEYLKADDIKVATTGNLAPSFTSRRYYYNFAEGYDKASYVILENNNLSSGFQSELNTKTYQRILGDYHYLNIYYNNGIWVFKKLEI